MCSCRKDTQNCHPNDKKKKKETQLKCYVSGLLLSKTFYLNQDCLPRYYYYFSVWRSTGETTEKKSGVEGCCATNRTGRRFGAGANVAGTVFSRSAHWAAPGSADLLHVHGCVADNASLQAAGRKAQCEVQTRDATFPNVILCVCAHAVFIFICYLFFFFSTSKLFFSCRQPLANLCHAR